MKEEMQEFEIVKNKMFNRGIDNEFRNSTRNGTRMYLIQKYGGKCIVCGFDDDRALCVKRLDEIKIPENISRVWRDFRFLNKVPPEHLMVVLCANHEHISRMSSEQMRSAARVWNAAFKDGRVDMPVPEEKLKFNKPDIKITVIRKSPTNDDTIGYDENNHIDVNVLRENQLSNKNRKAFKV